MSLLKWTVCVGNNTPLGNIQNASCIHNGEQDITLCPDFENLKKL